MSFPYMGSDELCSSSNIWALLYYSNKYLHFKKYPVLYVSCSLSFTVTGLVSYLATVLMSKFKFNVILRKINVSC